MAHKICAFYSVGATLFLKNLVSLEGLLFIGVPLYCLCILILPSDFLPFVQMLCPLPTDFAALTLRAATASSHIILYRLLTGCSDQSV